MSEPKYKFTAHFEPPAPKTLDWWQIGPDARAAYRRYNELVDGGSGPAVAAWEDFVELFQGVLDEHGYFGHDLEFLNVESPDD